MKLHKSTQTEESTPFSFRNAKLVSAIHQGKQITPDQWHLARPPARQIVQFTYRRARNSINQV
jgi:hypothetical protein